ncbi:putative glycosyl transferase [Lentisphaera araneosa HTCC2155]|uniref:Putative glycosyl transferase n=1 Tax=Lentisphaera araneosa HTCC2155 TaxID=313628 RepID=A6DJF7_9BACT|nr:glycosyltransferase family 4 protein [Lentisphaera araneosa]EDM28031.1 putative glycosyl transferase [Lentisphaera araneosa HTCC2155]
MKKLFLVNERFGRYSGAEQHIYVTLPFISQNFDVQFIYNEDTNKDSETLDELISTKHLYDFDAKDHRAYKQCWKLLNNEKPDVIYVHKCMNVGMLQAFRDYGCPLIRMQHDHDMYCMRSYKYNPLTRKICTKKAGIACIVPCMAPLKRERDESGSKIAWVSYTKQMQQIKINQSFDEVFVVSQYMKDELITQGFEERKIKIFPPVPLPKRQVPINTYSDENIIVFATQIIRGKGLDCLINALSLVKNDFKLYVFGSGSHKEYCQQLVKDLNLEDKIIFKGFVSQEELSNIYASAVMGTVPSVWPEPIATVGLEFLRHGLPVIGFDAGGIKDWLIDDTSGFLIPWMDIQAMADKIDLLLNDKKLTRKLGQSGRKFVNDKYNFDNYINKLVGHLEAVVTDHQQKLLAI